jgi:hypothetical protein
MRLLTQLLLSILLAGPAWAAIARVQKADTYPGNSVTLDGTTPGNFLVVAASWADATSDPTVSDTAQNTWNALPVLRGPAGWGAVSIQLFYAMNIRGGNTTVTLSSSPADVGVHAVEYSGVATSAALDVTNGSVAAGSTTTPTSGSFTPTAGDLVYVYFGDEALAQSTITAGTSYTMITTTGDHVDASEDKLGTASGAQTAGFTVGAASASWALYVATFKPSGASAALCGTADDGLAHTPPNYSCSSPPCTTNPFPPPAKGSTNGYVDPQYGCTVERLTDAVKDSLPAAHHQYSTITPINANDTYVMILLEDGSMEIVDTSGNVIVPVANMHATNSGNVPWDISVPTRFYYTNGAAILQGDISGLPDCAATHNCQVTPTTLHDFHLTYTMVQIPDQEDISDDGDHLWLVGDTSAFLYTISTHTVGPAMNVGTKESATGWHKIQIMPSNRMLLTWSANSPTPSASGAGQEVYNTDTTLNWHMLDITIHTDCGRDLSGNEVCVVDRVPDSGGGITGACPTWQPSQHQDGGIDVINMTTHGAQCLVDINWADTEVSFRDGNANGGWVFITFFKSGSCPSYSCFDTTPSSHLDPSWAANWAHFAEEGILVRIDNNNGPNTQRLFHTRSRSTEYYWAIPRGAISRDGKYVVFDSNFDISNTGLPNYTDVYRVKTH